MKSLKILPGAAGIIALTTTVGFVDGQDKFETDCFSREKISLVGTPTNISNGNNFTNVPDIKPDRPAYLVEINRGNTIKVVLIDAFTGQILFA